MADGLISHGRLDLFFARLAEKGTLFVPRTDEAGDAALVEWSGNAPVTLTYKNFRRSPKCHFLPQSQTILRFKEGECHQAALPDGKSILFGVRPCDARALLLLDKVFLDGSQADPYYARTRELTTVITLACGRTMPSCFCTSVGGGPGDATGADILAVDLATDLLLRAETAKGEDLVASIPDILAGPSPAALEEGQDRVRIAENQLARVRTEDAARRLGDAYDSPLWQTAGRKCLGCGACSFLCPTCHCFDITDEVHSGGGRRVRTWDCCAYPLFTMQGSGHNPRPTPRERWRQRVMHKFRYAVETFGLPFCVGCGRCIRNCPVSMDLRAALEEVGA